MRAISATLAGKGHQVVVPAVIATCPRKAAGKDRALQKLPEGFLHVGRWRVVLALAVELTGACQFKPGLEVLGYRAAQQRALGMAWVVSFGGIVYSGLLFFFDRIQRDVLIEIIIVDQMIAGVVAVNQAGKALGAE